MMKESASGGGGQIMVSLEVCKSDGNFKEVEIFDHLVFKSILLDFLIGLVFLFFVGYNLFP